MVTTRSKSATSPPPLETEAAMQQNGTRIILVFHIFALLWFGSVWFWHLGDDAKKLPGANEFGWFFRYLTFFGFTLQVLQLLVCCLAGILTTKPRLLWLADTLSCAVFGVAHVITINHKLIWMLTKAPVEGAHIERPFFLGFTVHYANSLIAWIDLLLAERMFRKGSYYLAGTLAAVYLFWINICFMYTGIFPYPFLNLLPHPWGLLGTAGGSIVILCIILLLGKRISRSWHGRRAIKKKRS